MIAFHGSFTSTTTKTVTNTVHRCSKATLLAAAVIGCFSWTTPQNGSEQHWLGPAAWYCSLILSLTAVLLSSSEAFIFSAIKNAPPGSPESSSETDITRSGTMPDRLIQELAMIVHCEGRGVQPAGAVRMGTVSSCSIPSVNTGVPTNHTERHRSDQQQQDLDPEEATRGSDHERGADPIRVTIRWNMVFTWQAPIMLVAYSVVAFFVGLVVYVCKPLYDGHEGEYLNGPGKV